MNGKGRKARNQAVNSNLAVNVLSQEELDKRKAAVLASMKASTLRDLETKGQFTKNDKLTFISDDMLILGCDIGSEMHYVRAIDPRGRELSKGAFEFSNSSEGFQSAKDWALNTAAERDKHKIVLGSEPTGHYWFCLAAWMVANDISAVGEPIRGEADEGTGGQQPAQGRPEGPEVDRKPCERRELWDAISSGRAVC